MNTVYVVRPSRENAHLRLLWRGTVAGLATLGLIALCSAAVGSSERASLVVAGEDSGLALGRQAALEWGSDDDAVDDSTLGPDSQRAALGGESGHQNLSSKKMKALKAMGKNVDPNKPAIDSHGNIIPAIPKVHIMRSASQILKDMMKGKTKAFQRPKGIQWDKSRSSESDANSREDSDPDSPGFGGDSWGHHSSDEFKGREEQLESRAQVLKAKMRNLEQQEGDDQY